MTEGEYESEGERDVLARLRRAELASPPEGLRGRVLARARASRGEGWRLPLALAASLAIVCALGAWDGARHERRLGELARFEPPPARDTLAELGIDIDRKWLERRLAVARSRPLLKNIRRGREEVLWGS